MNYPQLVQISVLVKMECVDFLWRIAHFLRYRGNLNDAASQEERREERRLRRDIKTKAKRINCNWRQEKREVCIIHEATSLPVSEIEDVHAIRLPDGGSLNNFSSRLTRLFHQVPD